MERETVKVRWISLFLFLLSLALAQSLMGRASVVDGDTLEIQGVRIRLWGIDAVESSQTCLDAGGKPWPCGRRAAFALADFLGGRTVRCERRGADRYGRVLAVCHVGGVEVNRWLVEQGWALAYVEYGGKVYLEAQRQAQAARRGVWQGSFQPPWEYRKSPGAVPSAGSYSGAGKAGRCDPAYPTVCIPPPRPTWTARTSPSGASRFFPRTRMGLTGTGTG
jgi:endonuclease YncB( thermonuclease family)